MDKQELTAKFGQAVQIPDGLRAVLRQVEYLDIETAQAFSGPQGVTVYFPEENDFLRSTFNLTTFFDRVFGPGSSALQMQEPGSAITVLPEWFKRRFGTPQPLPEERNTLDME